MSNEQYSAKITLDGSEADATLLRLARDTGQLNQALANAVTSGLKPFAAAMDKAAQKAHLASTKLKGKGGGVVDTRELSKAATATLTPQQQARKAALSLFDSYKQLSESGVKPTSRALLTLAHSFETAAVPMFMSKKLFQDAATSLRAMEAGANRAGAAIRNLEQIERAEARTKKQNAKDKAAAEASIKAAQGRIRTRFQTQEAGQESSIFNSNSAEDKRNNAADYSISAGVIRDRQKNQMSRRQLSGSTSALETRVTGTPFANVYKGAIASAKSLAGYADATRSKLDQERQIIIDIGRKIALATAKQREQAALIAVGTKERRAALRAQEQANAAEERNIRLMLQGSRQRDTDTNREMLRVTTAKKLEHSLAGMAQHSTRTEKALLKMSSASQGVMLGQSLMQRQVIGVGFSLIFARWAIIKYMAAAAGLTLTIGLALALSKAFHSLAKAGSVAATAFEKSGQQLANFFQSADIAQKIKSQASQLAKSYDIPRESAEKLLSTLESIGLNQDVYRKADVNASSAGVGAPGDFGQRLKDITKADADTRGEMTRQLAKDYNIPIKKYASSLEIAIAVNKRFANSAANSGNTVSGQLNKMSQGWYDFQVEVGAVVNQFLLPLLQPIMGFIQGITDGFAAARDAAIKTGDLNKNVASFAQTMRKLTPFMIHFGYILGTVIFKAVIRTAQIIKVLADTLIRLWNRTKPVRDAIQVLVQAIKELLDKLIGWYQHNENLVKILLGLGFVIFGLPRLIALFINALTDAIVGILSLGKAILGLPKAIVNFAMDGFKAVWDAIQDLLRSLGLIGDKHTKITSTIVDADKVDAYGKSIKDIPDTKHTKITNDVPGDSGAANMPKVLAPDGNGLGAITGSGFINGLKGFLLANGGGIFTGLVLLLSKLAPLIFTPVGAMVAAAIIIGIVVGLAIAFPKETGNIVGIIAGAMLNAIVQVPGLIALGVVNMVRVIVRLIETSFETAFEILSTIFMIPFNVIKSTVENVVRDVKKIINDFKNGDWLGVAKGVGQLLKDLTVQPLIDMGKEIGKALDKIITDIIPRKFGELYEKIKGPLGIDFLKNNLGEPIKAWGEKFAGGFNETFDQHVVPSFKKNFGKAWDSIQEGFGESDTVHGLKNVLKVGLAGLQWIGDNIGNPFSRLGDFIRRIWDYMLRFLSWIGNNAANLNPANWLRGIAGAFGGVEWPSFDMGGVVPGRAGTKVPVMATAGEVFLGAPSVARSSGRLNGLDGGGTTNIFIGVSDSVITNDAAMTQLADKVTGQLIQRLGFSKSLTYHRV